MDVLSNANDDSEGEDLLSTRYKDETKFVVSPLVDVGSFLDECQSTLDSVEEMLPGKVKVTTQEMADRIGTTVEIVQELEQVCSAESLYCPLEKEHPLSEAKMGVGTKLPPGTEHLKSLQLRRKRFLKRDVKSVHKEDQSLEGNAEYNKDEDAESSIHKPKALLAVLVFRPSETVSNRYLYKTKYIDRELNVLVDQKLTSLRDKLVCSADESIEAEDCSDIPTASQEDSKAKDIFKSSYFLIENTFYNDMRHPTSRDLSKVVIDYAKGKNTTLHSKPMEEVSFSELRVRLGYPYLFCHLGSCHHVFVFTELRLLTNTDCQELSQYPVLVHKSYWQRNMCFCCYAYTPRWVTLSDSFSPIDPTFFCDTCFKMLHYDKDGHKLGSFLAYPYKDPGIFS